MYYQSPIYRQKGRGLGSFFSHMFTKLIPFARSTLLPAAQRYIVPHATAMLKNVASDVINQKQSFREAMKNHGLDALKNAGNSVINQSGSGRRRKRSLKRKRSVSRKNHSGSKRIKLRKIKKSAKLYKLKRKDIFG